MWISFFLIIIASTTGFGQNLQELESRRQRLEDDIAYRKKLIQRAEKESQQGLANISAIRLQIEERTSLLSMHEEQKNVIEDSMAAVNVTLSALDEQEDLIVSSLSQILEHTYRQSFVQNQFALILSARTLQEAWKRLLYTRQFNRFQKRQLKRLKTNRKEKEIHLVELESIRQQKLALIMADQENQRELIVAEEKEKNLLESNEAKRNELNRELKTLETSYTALNKEIKKLIERSLSEKASAKSARSVAFDKLTGEFNDNRGKLPWPVNHGVVSRRYGKQVHPHLKNVTIQNNGIDLQLDERTNVHAIFSGSVIAIRTVPGMDYTVIVQHGDFYSVYAYMNEVLVEEGQQIKTSQMLGRTRKNPRSRIFEFHFEIWEGKETVDPEKWLN